MPGLFLWDIFSPTSQQALEAAQQKLLSEIEGLMDSLQRSPDSAAYIRLAGLYKQTGRHANALAVLQEGLDRCPPSLDLFRACIFTLRRCNRPEEAIATADRCLMALPGADSADIRIGKL